MNKRRRIKEREARRVSREQASRELERLEHLRVLADTERKRIEREAVVTGIREASAEREVAQIRDRAWEFPAQVKTLREDTCWTGRKSSYDPLTRMASAAPCRGQTVTKPGTKGTPAQYRTNPFTQEANRKQPDIMPTKERIESARGMFWSGYKACEKESLRKFAEKSGFLKSQKELGKG